MNNNAVACCFAPGGRPPAALVLVPAAMYVVRTWSTTFLGIEPARSITGPDQGQSLGPEQQQLVRRPDPAQLLAANAHVFLQRLIGRLPDALLSWFFSRVLNLSPETTETTVQFLKSQAAAGLPANQGAPALEAAAPASSVQEPTPSMLALPELPRHQQPLLESQLQTGHAAMVSPPPAQEAWAMQEIQAREPSSLPTLQQHQPTNADGNDLARSPSDTQDQQAALAEKLMSFAGELMIMANESTVRAPRGRREGSRRSKAPKGRGAGQNRASPRAGRR